LFPYTTLFRSLNPAQGDDQIQLQLAHAANNNNVTASFVLLHQGVVDTTTSFTSTGTIFLSASDTFTRGQFFAAAPAVSDTTLQGTYGTIDITQAGTWQYTLANNQTNVQALAQGQSVTDTFNVQAIDSQGASVTNPVTVT